MAQIRLFVLSQLLPALLVGIALGSPASAQAPAVALHGPCDGPGQHDWDFWIEDWTLSAMDGKAKGTAHISRASTGCGITETIASGGKPIGFSFNTFDPTRGGWTQLWASPGTVVRLDGKLNGAGHFLAQGSIAYTAKGVEHALQVTWTRLPDGRIQQDFFERDTATAPWHATFSQLYSPAGNGPAKP